MTITTIRKGADGLIRPALILLLAAFLLTGCAGKETVYEDYASAGAYCEEQYAAHSQSFSVTVHTSDYNQILGPGFVWDKVQKESVVHNGDPGQGDHLAIGIMGYSLTSRAGKQEGSACDLKMTVEPVYATTAEQEDELARTADAILQSLDLDGASEYDKALAIYRFICDHVVYDYDHLDDTSYLLPYSAYAAATKGTAVCAGIADLFYYLANSAGLDARIVTNANHAWNFVRVDGRYYYVDATWDLGRSEMEYGYFLKGSADFEHHLGNISFGPEGFSNLLTGSDLGYDFSPWSYGYDPYAF